MTSFWEAQCPSRLPGLHHVHDRDCEEGHKRNQCCECGRRASSWPTGLEVLTGADRECDHAKIPAKRLKGDKGERWPECPKCFVQVEPRMTKARA